MDDLKIMGISVRTSNLDGRSAQDIPKLWERFFAREVSAKIPHKVDDNLYVVYTDYESDYKGEYTCVIGCRVRALENVPSELVGYLFKNQKMIDIEVKGEIPAAVLDAWSDIWSRDSELNRTYRYDYELYKIVDNNLENSLVNIFIGVE